MDPPQSPLDPQVHLILTSHSCSPLLLSLSLFCTNPLSLGEWLPLPTHCWPSLPPVDTQSPFPRLLFSLEGGQSLVMRGGQDSLGPEPWHHWARPRQEM